MKGNYPYRFKTKEEFVKEFGEKWRICCEDFQFIDEMDYLLGTTIELTEFEFKKSLKSLTDGEQYFEIHRLDDNNIWFISKKYITDRTPNYKPKNFLKEI